MQLGINSQFYSCFRQFVSFKVDTKLLMVYNVFMIANYEVYNFLNMINVRLGKVYKLTGYSPLPKNFVMTKDLLKERLYLNQMSLNINFPNFVYENKNEIKKHFKNSIKNIKKMKKNIKNYDFSPQFLEKLEVYFDIRIDVTESLLNEFKNQRFDEKEAFQEIYRLNPILSKLFMELFEEHVDTEALLVNLEDIYEISYLQKLQMIEKKQKNTQRKTSQTLEQTTKQHSEIEKKKKLNAKPKENVSKIERELKQRTKTNEKNKKNIKEKQ